MLNLYGSDTRRCRFSIRLRFWILDAGDVRLLCALRAATNRDGAHATCLLFYPSPARSLTPVNGIVQIFHTFRKCIITQLLQPISMLLNQNQNYCNLAFKNNKSLISWLNYLSQLVALYNSRNTYFKIYTFVVFTQGSIFTSK